MVKRLEMQNLRRQVEEITHKGNKMTLKEKIEFAGFAMLEYGGDAFIIREKTDELFEVFLGHTLLGEYVTVEEAISSAHTGIDKMKKLNESERPTMSPSDWTQTDDGTDFVAEILYRAEGKDKFHRHEIGLALKDFGILATGSYIDYFTGLLNGQGIIVI